jgi:hypothetical protein
VRSSPFEIGNEAPRPAIRKLGIALQKVTGTNLPLLLGRIQTLTVRGHRFNSAVTEPNLPLLSSQVAE